MSRPSAVITAGSEAAAFRRWGRTRAYRQCCLCTRKGGRAPLRGGDGCPPHPSLHPFVLQSKDKSSSLCLEECILSLFVLVFLQSSWFRMSGIFAFWSKRFLPTLCSCPHCPWNCGQETRTARPCCSDTLVFIHGLPGGRLLSRAWRERAREVGQQSCTDYLCVCVCLVKIL